MEIDPIEKKGPIRCLNFPSRGLSLNQVLAPRDIFKNPELGFQMVFDV